MARKKWLGVDIWSERVAGDGPRQPSVGPEASRARHGKERKKGATEVAPVGEAKNRDASQRLFGVIDPDARCQAFDGALRHADRGRRR